MFNVLSSLKIAAKTIGVFLAKAWAVPAIAVLGLAGYNTEALTHPTPAPVQIIKQVSAPTPDYTFDASHLENRIEALERKGQNLGSSNALPVSVAIFSTSLQSAITSSATTMTLVSATYNNGASTIASSTYDFIIDEGTAAQEFVSADCTGTTCTNMTRGLSWLNGTTTVSALQFAHRRGASVKITDAPIVLKLNWLALGGMGYPGPINYASIATSTIAQSRNNLASWGLVQDTAFTGSGAIKATTGAAGYSQLATQLQQASSTASSNGNPLVLQAANATSSCATIATSALNVLVADNFGKLNGNCVPATITSTSTYTAGAAVSFSTSTATTTNIGSFPAYWIGKNIKVFTSSGTFTVPAGVNKVFVRLLGAGAGGGGGSGSHYIGSTGGPGGYGEAMIDVTGTTSIAVTIAGAGVGGSGSNPGASGGTTYFSSFANCTSGTGGSAGSSGPSLSSGSAGGTCTGTDFTITTNSQPSLSVSSSADIMLQGFGGSPEGGNTYGFGGYPQINGAGLNGGPGLLVVTW